MPVLNTYDEVGGIHAHKVFIRDCKIIGLQIVSLNFS